ncbi:hypothetical protein ISN45_Aa04g006740 [Arabidopsis thaliana x Arabidopsis arenosa]|uniref:At2g29880-like C-terminal domain-containing protein n=1 Tax=Arabidopsis thaliana x Arabidopsis arenosa TaxID=1240361 RepID=A0A8T2A3U6_9BRAS|nr:hypothetical protein ISN45_Aa04g006740 [Arabidopsis thaliana x Arabidopsis arenosa]
MDDMDGIPYDEKSVHDVFSSIEKNRLEKLPQRKKARTDAFNSNKAFDEVNTVQEFGNQILGMIQRRWKKETEEKEAEDKAENVWEAITEIPDLTIDLRYEAMTLVHSLDMEYNVESRDQLLYNCVHRYRSVSMEVVEIALSLDHRTLSSSFSSKIVSKRTKQLRFSE